MTDNNHPITPPPEMVQQWYDNMGPDPGPFESFAIAAARWGADQQLKLDIEQVNRAWQKGADQELEACCEWVSQWCGRWPDGTRPEEELRATRRPKPPSLKEQALETLKYPKDLWSEAEVDTIRRALELLDD